MSTKPSEMSGEELVDALAGSTARDVERILLVREAVDRLKQLDDVRLQRDAWMKACRDAIRRPMGVVPDSVDDAMKRRLDGQFDDARRQGVTTYRADGTPG